MRYAEVIVDLASESVDRVFTYSVPEHLALEEGHRVLVPFGSRKIEGFVMGFRSEPGMDPAKIRSIIARLEDYPALLPEMIRLAQWMRERYHCNLVDALRLMIPAQMRGGRVREKTVRVAALRLQGPELERAMGGLNRAPKQKALVEALLKGPMPTGVLNAMIPGADVALRSLSEKGLVSITSDEVQRRPYDNLSHRPSEDPPLMPEQRQAVDELLRALEGRGGRFLLNGVTGSGKTEVYIHAIRQVLKSGRTAIVLVPEIALTPQMVDWFRARFGDDAAVLHSRLSAGERFDEWRRIRRGEAKVVVGARSAVFAPNANLGMIIVDEEHEQTYLSEHRPRYDAREVAQKRCEDSSAVLLLGSATPSIASYMRTMPGVRPENRLTLLRMSERVMGRPLPQVDVVDMRNELSKGNKSMFSGELMEAMRDCLDQGHQMILFINRRGHSSFVSCRACGHVVKCDACDVAMTYHQADGKLKCHYCGKEILPPKTCPACSSKFIKYFGAGTQKVEEEVKRYFPGVAVDRMDVDTTREKDAHLKILSRFRRGESRILIGTQMIAKGLDFPNVTLVGVVAADMSLNLPDYRSVERTFQLITQVAGRAGRAEYPGRVIVQTYDPDHYGIRLSARQDYAAFYHQEADRRRRGLYPPYTVLARLLVSAREEERACQTAQRLEAEFSGFLNGPEGYIKDVVQMRALEAPLKMIRNEYRYQVFIKLYARGQVEPILGYMEELSRQPVEGVRIELEVNPANMI